MSIQSSFYYFYGGQCSNEMPEMKSQQLQQHLDMAQSIRKKAAQKSSDANKKAIKCHASKLPHSVYTIGDRVFVKTNKKKWNKVRGKGVATKQSSVATVVAVNVSCNRYKVRLDNSPSPVWVSVSALTSLTRDIEWKREKVQGNYNIKASQPPPPFPHAHICDLRTGRTVKLM